MTYSEFKEWVVRRLRRSDISASSPALHEAIMISRSEIQKALNLGDMEFQAKYELPLSEGDYRFALPAGFREAISVRVLDSNENLKIVLAKETDRSKFVRLVTIDLVSWASYEYKNSLIILTTEGVEGFPLIYNIWNQILEVFPKVGNQAVGYYLWMDYRGYLPDNLENESPNYTDCLLDEFKDVLFYRTMMELSMDLKDAETVDRYQALYTAALIRANSSLVRREQAGYDGGTIGG